MRPKEREPAPVFSARPSTCASPFAQTTLNPPLASGGRGGLAWRYEFKYVLPRHLRSPLTADLRSFATPDAHTDPEGYYTVRSLYLDSLDWGCFFDKAAGLSQRHKLRIRAYVSVDSPTIKFEIKRRQGNKIHKQVAPVDLEDYKALLLALHQRRMADAQLLARLPELVAFFRVQHLHAMAPVINVQFRRQAFVARGDRHCRITIDDSLTACPARDLFETMTSARPLLAQMNAVLEIKVGSTVPFWLNQLIRKYRLQVASISKYNYAVANGPFGLDGVC